MRTSGRPRDSAPQVGVCVCVSAAWLLTALSADGSSQWAAAGGFTSVWLKTSLSDFAAFSSGAALHRAVIHFHDSSISITLSGEDKYV